MKELLEKLKANKDTKGNWYLYTCDGIVLMGHDKDSRILGQVYMTQKEATILSKKFNKQELSVEDYL